MSSTADNPANKKQLLWGKINRNGLILALFAFLSTGLIAITHQLTKQKIALAVEHNMISQLSQIVPQGLYDNEVYQDCIKIRSLSLLGSNRFQKAYRLRKHRKDVALLLTAVAPDGYSGPIEFSMAISKTGQIMGLNIISHRETPGLGDKIERRKGNWLDQFNGLAIKNKKQNWGVKKDGGQFDALTGATITPRAMVKAAYNALLFYQQHQQQLFTQASNCYQKDE
ncbi:MAG: electron transport complex subunit RsxG [Enterobacterales bacterium]|nr:electron transport complex subunit RsxG [Enterobacterales bacterium]